MGIQGRPMNEHNELAEAIEIVGVVRGYHSFPGSGGIWCGRNREAPDGLFTDWGLARAVAIILNAVNDGRLKP
jgi:hypothetical protein